MSDIVGTSVSGEPFTVLEFKKVSNNAHEQEVNDLCEFLKLEHNKYVQYKLIYDVVEECVSETSDLDRTLKAKITNILLSSSVNQSLSLDECVSNESTSSLFGCRDVNKQELSYIERIQLQEVLKCKLDRKYKSICDKFHKATSEDINNTLEDTPSFLSLQMESNDKVLIEYKNKLILEQEQYVENLLSLSELLNEITNLRLNKLPQITEQKIKECQVEERINHLKSMLAREKVRIDIFTETSCSLKAYKELMKDIKDQQQECEKEIRELKDLKEKYNQVSSKQYNDILKSYLQYKSAIEKKKLLYECLKC